jgi:hypothetical protein
MTENVSAGGFLCTCPLMLPIGTVVGIHLGTGIDSFVGRARVVRKESPHTPWQRYALQFLESTHEWVMNPV